MKEKEAQRIVQEKAEIEALILKNRPNKPQTPDEVDQMGISNPNDEDRKDNVLHTYKKHETNADHPPIVFTYTYDHISQHITDLADSTQQDTLHSMEQDTSSFTTDSSNPCHFNIAHHDLDSDPTCSTSNQSYNNSIHAVSKQIPQYIW